MLRGAVGELIFGSRERGKTGFSELSLGHEKMSL